MKPLYSQWIKGFSRRWTRWAVVLNTDVLERVSVVVRFGSVGQEKDVVGLSGG